MSTSNAGLRKRRTHLFVQIPSDTIRDKRLSFRARGLLAYLLDLPDGWDVKSEFLATQGKEGREAIRTALHELGETGYYRIERRQLLNGTFSMGTAISEEPVDQWAADYAEYTGRAVPCQQQRDGSFLVKHKDGTLSEDGFEVAVDATHGSDETHTGIAVTTGDGFSGPGFPGPGSPDSGAPDSGSLGALREKDTRDTQGTTSASLRSVADADPEPKVELTDTEVETGRDADGKALRGKKLDALAQAVTVAWWEWIEPNGHSKPAQSFLACRGVIRSALGNGIDPKSIKRALATLTTEGRPVSGVTLQIAMQVQPAGRRGDIDWDAAEKRAAAMTARLGLGVAQ